MTHSLHRFGELDSLKRDFVWFMYQTKGINDTNIKPKALQFIAAAEAVGSENWGDVKTGPVSRFSADEIKAHISDKSRIRGIFTRRRQVVEFLRRVKAADTGMSVVIAGVLSEVLPACREAGVTPHSINYSLGAWGKKDKLPDDTTLAITTMCGHHMIAPQFVEQVMNQVEKGVITPEEGANKLSNFCYCGIFNHVRCADIMRQKISGNRDEVAAASQGDEQN